MESNPDSSGKNLGGQTAPTFSTDDIDKVATWLFAILGGLGTLVLIKGHEYLALWIGSASICCGVIALVAFMNERRLIPGPLGRHPVGLSIGCIVALAAATAVANWRWIQSDANSLSTNVSNAPDPRRAIVRVADAILQLDPDHDGSDRAVVDILYRNFGKTSATNFLAAITTDVSDAKGPPPPFPWERLNKQKGTGIIVAPGQGTVTKSEKRINGAMREAIIDGKIRYWVFGWLKYDDDFGGHCQVPFRYYLGGDWRVPANYAMAIYPTSEDGAELSVTEPAAPPFQKHEQPYVTVTTPGIEFTEDGKRAEVAWFLTNTRPTPARAVEQHTTVTYNPKEESPKDVVNRAQRALKCDHLPLIVGPGETIDWPNDINFPNDKAVKEGIKSGNWIMRLIVRVKYTDMRFHPLENEKVFVYRPGSTVLELESSRLAGRENQPAHIGKLE